MKTKELETPKENGVEEVKKTATQDIILTSKQAEMLKQVIQEKNELKQLANEVSKREVMLSSLIIDGAGIDEEEVETANVNQEGTILTIVKKE